MIFDEFLLSASHPKRNFSVLYYLHNFKNLNVRFIRMKNHYDFLFVLNIEKVIGSLSDRIEISLRAKIIFTSELSYKYCTYAS